MPTDPLPSRDGEDATCGPDPVTGRRASADAAYAAGLDEVTELLRGQARSWAQQLRLVHGLGTLAPRTSFRSGQFAALEMAGSWSVGQLTAARWQWEAERFHDALPRTLAMLRDGRTAGAPGDRPAAAHPLLHRGGGSGGGAAGAARRRGAGALGPHPTRGPRGPAGRVRAGWGRRCRGAHADAAAQRRTFAKATQDGMGMAGALLTAEQVVGWRTGLDALERRERVADRQAGVERTAGQRRADLFAALPAMVLAGTAQDRAAATAAEAAQAPDVPVDEDATAAPPGSCVEPVALQPWTLGPEQVAAQVVVNVLVPVATVLDLSRAPGAVDGSGPVSAEHVGHPCAAGRPLPACRTTHRRSLDSHGRRPTRPASSTPPPSRTTTRPRSDLPVEVRETSVRAARESSPVSSPGSGSRTP